MLIYVQICAGRRVAWSERHIGATTGTLCIWGDEWKMTSEFQSARNYLLRVESSVGELVPPTSADTVLNYNSFGEQGRPVRTCSFSVAQPTVR